MKRIALLVKFLLAMLLLCGCGRETNDLADMSTYDNGEYVGILWEDRSYVPFAPIDPRMQEEQLGFVNGDEKDKVYACRDCAPEEWLINRYESGEMDISMLMREESVTALPEALTDYVSDYEWNAFLSTESEE